MMAIRRQQRHQRLWWLMGMACVIPLIDAFFAISSETLSGPVFDKMAFHLGRQCGALHFACVYSCIMVRLLIGTRSKIGKYILPALAGLILLAALCFLFFIKFADQESTEVLGLHIKGIAIRQCAQGVFSMMPTIGFVMILTPVLIPSVYIARIGELFSKDIQTGTQAFDEYLKFSRKDKKVRPKASFPIQHKTSLQVQKKPRMPFPAQNMNSDQSEDDPDERPDVLLVEDDLACAALVLKFCKKIKLECIHVESLDEAQQKFKSYQHCLRLLLLDNFVRVGDSVEDGIKTGSQWAALLNKRHPKSQRRFHIAILSGHTHLLAELGQEADLVLQKPWDPRELFRYLKDQQIV